jgi:WhiB family redox-sensing transcriptional regulator
MASTNDHHNETTEPDAWMIDAYCRRLAPAEFFPSDGLGVEDAQRVCNDCRVRADCLQYALDNRIDHGVWGGTSERERRRILSRRNHLQPTACD